MAQSTGQDGCVLGTSSYCCDPPATPTTGNTAAAASFQALAEAWLEGGAICDPTAGGGSIQDRSDPGPSRFPNSYDMAEGLGPEMQPALRNDPNSALFQHAFDLALEDHPGVTPLTLNDMINVASTRYDLELALNEAFCETVNPSMAIARNNEASDLCPSINPQPCPSFTQERLDNTNPNQAFNAETNERITADPIDLSGTSLHDSGAIFRPLSADAICRLEYGQHVEIIGTGTLPPLKTRVEDRDCSIHLECTDMYIYVPPGASLWSGITVPQGEGSPLSGPSGVSQYDLSNGGVINNVLQNGINGPVYAFSHVYANTGCAVYVTFKNTQVDNYGNFFSFQCLGYPECVFDASTVQFPGGTGPPGNPGTGPFRRTTKES